MNANRPLPTVIGPTENALRALLQKTLDRSPIGHYPQWVAMNLADRESLSAPDFTVRLAEELKGSAASADRTVQQLVNGGLMHASADGCTLTQSGEKSLREGRRVVKSATDRLAEGIAQQDIEITIRTLDIVRTNAERELLRQHSAGSADGDGN